jgi:hypothetical protein
VEEILRGGKREDRERTTGDGTGEAADLRERAGSEAEDDGDDEEEDRPGVEQIHGAIVAQQRRVEVVGDAEKG